jgi:hypothetical protein
MKSVEWPWNSRDSGDQSRVCPVEVSGAIAYFGLCPDYPLQVKKTGWASDDKMDYAVERRLPAPESATQEDEQATAVGCLQRAPPE